MSINTRFIRDVRAAGIEAYDVRSQMPARGLYTWRGNTWAYNTVHYTGVWRERGSYQQELNSWLGHARFHVNNRGWPGIAYNIGISPSGRVWLMKDIERWGYHAFNTNAISMAVSCDLTEGQVPTPDMLKSLQVVLLVLEEILPNLRRQNVYTHRQMSWNDWRNGNTLCAGARLNAAIANHRGGTNFVNLAARIEPVKEIKPDHAYIALTDKWVVGPIYKRWTSVGGNVLVFGYPLTGEQREGTDNVQYFERAVFHRKPDSNTVHLQRIGREVADARYGRSHPAFAPVKEFTSDSLSRYFPQTRHSLSNGFKGYWEKYGGLELFGYPISEEFVEDNKVVQYFERARFEWAPGSDPKRFDVVLGRLGAEVLQLRT